MPVLDQLSHQVKWEPFVLSDINLSSFLAWAGKTETSELVAVLSLVNLGIHRGCGESPSVQVRSKEGFKLPNSTDFLQPRRVRQVHQRCQWILLSVDFISLDTTSGGAQVGRPGTLPKRSQELLFECAVPSGPSQSRVSC